jgi:hypothetical protein
VEIGEEAGCFEELFTKEEKIVDGRYLYTNLNGWSFQIWIK